MEQQAPEFPAERFRRVDATDDEIAQLTREFARSDLAAKTFIVDHLASIADPDIREMLEHYREGGHFDPKPVEDDDAEADEAEPVAPATIPATESGATAKAGDTTGADDTGAPVKS